MKSLVAGILAAAFLLSGRPGAQTDTAVEFLDTYFQGRFDDAVAAAARVRDADAVGRAVARDAAAWIDADPRGRDRRRLAVAAFVLEFTHARTESDWRTLYPLLEWACALLRSGGPPTEGERQWHLGVIAVAGRARDFGRLTPMPPDWARMMVMQSDPATLGKNVFKSGHLAHTAARFPGEPRILLAATMMAVSMYDTEAPRRYRDGAADPVAALQRTGVKSSLIHLEALLHAEPALAAEADMRAGHLQFALASFGKALALERSAAHAARDPETSYLAHFLAGRVLAAMKRSDEAAVEFQKALDVRPRGQSAALSLAALRTAAEQTQAFDLLRPALDSHSVFDDPWRLCPYGDYVRWPDTRAAIREALQVTRLAIVLACLATAQVFRSQTDAVSISASVKRANAPVANLTADDFRLTDNGVTQTIQLLTVESVPIDVTLFIDNSGSTSAVQDGMRRDTASIAAMLRPEDRLRVLTIGLAVDESVPWQDAGAPVTLQFRVVPGISLIYDALFAALTHRPAPGRRHLVVGLTDGEDCGSVVDGAMLLAASGRTEAVLHIIYASGGGNFSRNGAAAWCTPIDPESVDYVTRTADRTGGGMHMALFGNPTVSEFRKILDDFRASYVLRYSPRGVPRAGWHSVAVVVPAMPDVKIRARSGYFVDK